MPSVCPQMSRVGRGLAALVLLATPSAVTAGAGDGEDQGDGGGRSPLSIVGRSIALDRGRWLYWQVDYRLRNDGSEAVELAPEDLSARVSGFVSNSRVGDHATPRPSTIDLRPGPTGPGGWADVIASADECRRCRERASLSLWAGAEADEPPALDEPRRDAAKDCTPKGPEGWRIAPGETICARLRLEHEHFLYGPHDPLLGVREVELRLGPATVRDRLPLDRERRVARAAPPWPPTAPPDDRLDRRLFVSPPESLHLEAHVAGGRAYRFPDRPVRYATRMRLRFYYLIAPGTEGECRIRVAQYKDAPTGWKGLPDGAIEFPLTTVGRWVRVERLFQTEPEATTVSLDFRILNSASDIGELWIDDVCLEPADEPDAGGP